MAELLSPGVFIEEVPSNVQAVTAVSTSNMGIVGATQRGPSNVATLVTSYPQFERIFGPLIAESRLGLSMAAFFSNGGRRAYVVRVMPADAVTANADLQSKRDRVQSNTGDGSTATVDETVLTPVAVSTPMVPNTVSFEWRAAGTPVVTETLKQIDGTTDLVGDAATLVFAGRIDPTSLPAVDPDFHAVDGGAGTFTLNWTDGVGADSLTLAPSGDTASGTGGSSTASTATLDLKTGVIHMVFSATGDDDTPTATPITLSYTPTTATIAISDDGAGVITDTADLTGAGTIDYDAGTYSFTAEAASVPHSGGAIRVTHRVPTFEMIPISEGTWANDMRVDVSGNNDYYDAATNSFTRFDVSVLIVNPDNGNFEIIETFDEITFSDSTSSQYFPDVINDLSDLITVSEPPEFAEEPEQLNGRTVVQNIAGGNEVVGGKNVVGTLAGGPISSRSVVITFTADSDSSTKTITDDGAGNLIGDIDAAGNNTINYTTGAFDVTLSEPADRSTFVSCTFAAAAEETTHTDRFGDTTKNYTDGSSVEHFVAGTNGTFDSVNYGRTQFTDATSLEADFEGLYALNRVEELMQVVIPDFAGDVQITKDILDYVNARALQPSGGDRFAVLTVPQGSTAQEAVDFFRFDIQQFSRFAALYWPWVRVADPLANNRPTVFPPLGHIAGVYARTDQTRNVGKAPGGTIDGALSFLVDLETEPTQGERDVVYPNRVNPLISSPATGLAVWGVRTIAQESEWRYINARRLFMFVERSIYNATFWIVFENNGPALWARIKAQVQGFLNGLFNDGLFAGSTPAEAFFVIVDDTNNSPESIEAGQVIIDVGIAPNRPAEFVRFRFQQKTLSA